MRRIGYEIEPELVCVPAGYFWMGSNDTDPYAFDDEKPQHLLFLPEFWIGRYPVTVAQFAAFVDATGRLTKGERIWSGRWSWRQPKGPGSDLKGKDDHPAIHIGWHDALAYCQWLSQVTGRVYTLPSEAEWEKAARGTDGRIYPWGNVWDKSRCNACGRTDGDTTPLGYYSPQGDSPYGCADMVGNMRERTRSIKKPYPYNPNDGREDLITSRAIFRVLRSGAYASLPEFVRCALRFRDPPHPGEHLFVGFRVALAVA